MNKLIHVEAPNVSMSITNKSSTNSINTGLLQPNSQQLPSEILNDTISTTNNNSKEIVAPPEQTTKKLHNHEIVITSLISGAVAGALAKTVIAPLDRTKINFQINKDTKYSFRAAALFLKNTFEKEGFLALWRGNSATMARIIPYASIQFTAHEQWKKLLKIESNPDNHVRRFLSGALAGLTASSLTYPLDLARARMAVTDKYSGYRNLSEVFVKIWRSEGPKSLYRGYVPTLLGVIPYAGVSFFTYDTLKREYYILTGEKQPSTLYALMFGAIAGVCSQSSSYPLDIVRRRMQTTGVTPNCADKYLTVSSTIQKIYREEGIIRGFYKGLSMNWIKGPLAVGISFATYDHIKSLLSDVVHIHYR